MVIPDIVNPSKLEFLIEDAKKLTSDSKVGEGFRRYAVCRILGFAREKGYLTGKQIGLVQNQVINYSSTKRTNEEINAEFKNTYYILAESVLNNDILFKSLSERAKKVAINELDHPTSRTIWAIKQSIKNDVTNLRADKRYFVQDVFNLLLYLLEPTKKHRNENCNSWPYYFKITLEHPSRPRGFEEVVRANVSAVDKLTAEIRELKCKYLDIYHPHKEAISEHYRKSFKSIVF